MAATLKRAALLLAAAGMFSVAFMLIIAAGLPDRAEFTGYMIDGNELVAPELNAIPPPFAKPTLGGNIINLQDLRGVPVIINFWATWCEPCVVEMPELQALYDAYHSRGLRLIAVNLGESRATVDAWIHAHSLTFDVVLDSDGSIAAAYRLRGQPSTYLVSPAGIISSISYGPVSMPALQSQLDTFFTKSQ